MSEKVLVVSNPPGTAAGPESIACSDTLCLENLSYIMVGPTGPVIEQLSRPGCSAGCQEESAEVAARLEEVVP